VERPDNVRAHTYTQSPNTQTPNTQPCCLAWRTHCCVEVIVFSTNKQHTLSLASCHPNSQQVPS
jgi:hypothetical protein